MAAKCPKCPKCVEVITSLIAKTEAIITLETKLSVATKQLAAKNAENALLQEELEAALKHGAGPRSAQPAGTEKDIQLDRTNRALKVALQQEQEAHEQLKAFCFVQRSTIVATKEDIDRYKRVLTKHGIPLPLS